MGFVADVFGKGKPDVPPAPDYNAIAKTQGAENVNTAITQSRLNNPNIVNPYGTQTVSYAKTPQFDQTGYDAAMKAYQTGSTAPAGPTTNFYTQQDFLDFNKKTAQRADDAGNAALAAAQYAKYQAGGYGDDAALSKKLGTNLRAYAPQQQTLTAPTRDQFTTYSEDYTQPTVTQTLNPEQQSLLDAQNRISQNLANTAESGLNRVSDSMATPFDMSQVGARGALPTVRDMVAGPQVQGQTAAAQYGALPGTSNFQNYDERSQFNQAIPQADAESAARVARALYARAAPQLEYQNRLQNNQAMAGGHNLGGNAMNAMADNQNRGWNDLALASDLAGGQEQSRLFNLQMQQAQMGDNRANTLQQQGLQNAGFNNQNLANLYQQQMANAQMGDTRANTQFGQTEAAKQALFNQQLAAGQFQSGQNLSQFNQEAQIFGLQGNQRQQDIQEQAYLRSLPLNELNALRTGSQATMPSFQQYTGGGNIAPAPIMSGAITADQRALLPYNADMQANQQFNQGLFSLAGAAAPMLPGYKVG